MASHLPHRPLHPKCYNLIKISFCQQFQPYGLTDIFTQADRNFTA